MNDSKKTIRDFVVRNKINTCAFHGLTEISRLFLEWFQKWEIEVLYIVEDVNNIDNYKGVPNR